MIRETEKYGDVELSIVAGQYLYCEPQTDLPFLSQYTKVEVAIVVSGRLSQRIFREYFSTPERLGLPASLDGLWGGDQVAGYVSESDLELLRGALRDRAAGMSTEDRTNMHAGRVEMLEVGARP